MHRYVRRGVCTALFTGGLWLVGTQLAHADTPPVDNSAAVQAPVSIPVAVTGNSVSVLSDSGSNPLVAVPSAGGVNGAVNATAALDPVAQVPVSAPIDISANTVTIGGRTSSAAAAPDAPASPSSGVADSNTPNDGSLAQAPVTATGNTVAILSDTGTPDTTSGTATATGTGADSGPAPTTGDTGTGTGEATTSNPTVQAPITVCGITVGVLGDASADCTGASSPAGDTASAPSGNGTDGDAPAPSLITAPIGVPVNVCGITVGVLGDASADCATAASGPAGTSDPTAPSNPSNPTAPAGPTDPGALTDPTGPAGPANPALPTVPGQPTGLRIDLGQRGLSLPVGAAQASDLLAGRSTQEGSRAIGSLPYTGFSAIEIAGFGIALVLGGLLLMIGLTSRRQRC